MSFFPVAVAPGVVKADSPYAATGRWIDAEKMRFNRGYPEKIGGFQKLIEGQFEGYARGAKAWAAYDGTQLICFGTATDFITVRNGTMSTITPFRVAGISLTNPFVTTSGSASVRVNDIAHGITSIGTKVLFSGASAVGGITINGEYLVASIISDDAYTITAASNASSSATGGGSVTASYYINVGLVDPEYLTGWGIGLFGYGYFGTDVSIALGLLSEPMVWGMDNYGEDLILCPLDGTLFHYDVSLGAVQPAVITNAPTQVRSVFVTPERYIFALGCTTLAGGYDKMTVRWPDIEDYTDWTPTSVNTSNERKLQGGSRLVNGTSYSQGISLVWSDSSMFIFQYTGADSIYDSRKIADECGLIGPHAFCKTDSMVFWMSNKDFHVYNGAMQSIPNSTDIGDWVFSNINDVHAIKSFALFNKQYNEVWFFFPTTGTEPDTYVAVNLDDFSWVNGTVDRTAAAKFSVGEGRPVLFGTDGYVWVHEVEDSANDGNNAMEAYIELAPFDFDNGNQLVDVFGFIPDLQRQTGDLSLYIYGKDHPRDDVVMSETVTILATDKIIDLRIAGRQIGMKITSNEMGGDFRLGKIGLEVSGAGKKRNSST